MMKTIILATAMGLTLLCAFFSSPIQAGEALDSLNAEVEQQAEQIDQQFGVLLTNTERGNLKIGLIVSRLKAKKAEQPEKTVEALVEEAISTYQIMDPVAQRQLLIETETTINRSSGAKPPCCK